MRLVLYRFIAETLLCMHYTLVTTVVANIDNHRHVIRVICLKCIVSCQSCVLCSINAAAMADP